MPPGNNTGDTMIISSTSFVRAMRIALVCSVSVASAAVHAAEPEAPVAAEAEAAGFEEIVVAGAIVAAQAASVEAKRAALNLIDIAAADAVGRFPDQNSAAALLSASTRLLLCVVVCLFSCISAFGLQVSCQVVRRPITNEISLCESLPRMHCCMQTDRLYWM